MGEKNIAIFVLQHPGADSAMLVAALIPEDWMDLHVH